MAPLSLNLGALAASVHLESKLLTRTNGTRLLCLCFAAIAFLSVRVQLSEPLGTWTTARVTDYIREGLPIYQLLAMLWAALVASQDSSAGFEQLRRSYAYDEWRRVGAHLLPIIIGTAIMSSLTMAITSLPIVAQHAAPVRIGTLAASIPLVMWLKLAYASLLGYVLGIRVKSGIALYPTLLAVWFVLGAAPIAYELGKRGAEWAAILGMTGDTGVRVVEAPVLAEDNLLRWSHCLVYMGLSAAVLAFSEYSICKWRYPMGATLSLFILALSMAVTAIGSWIFLTATHRRITVHKSEIKLIASLEKSMRTKPTGLLSDAAAARAVNPIRSYNLTAALDGARHRLTCTGDMVVINSSTNPQPSIFLTLRRNLKVSKAWLSDGTALLSELQVTRDGDFLAVKLPEPLAPGTSIRLSMSWSGRVEHWRRSFPGQFLSTSFHIAPNSVFIPEYYGWYPLPGLWQLAVSIYDGDGRLRDVSDQLIPLAPTPSAEKAQAQAPTFSIVVKGFGKTSVDTGLGRAGRGRVAGAYLMAGNRVSFTRNGILVSCYRDHQKAMQTVADMVARRWSFFSRLLSPNDEVNRADSAGLADLAGLVEEPSATFITKGGLPGQTGNIYIAEYFVKNNLDLSGETDEATDRRGIGRELTKMVIGRLLPHSATTVGSHTVIVDGIGLPYLVKSALTAYLSILFDESIKPGSYEKFMSAWRAAQSGGIVDMRQGIDIPPTPVSNGVIRALDCVMRESGLGGLERFLKFVLSQDSGKPLPIAADDEFRGAKVTWNNSLSASKSTLRQERAR